MLEKNDIFFTVDEESESFFTWFVEDIFVGSNGELLYSVRNFDDFKSNLEKKYYTESEIIELENTDKIIDRNSFVKKKNEVMKYTSNKSSSLDNDRMSKEEIRSIVEKICHDVRDNKVFDNKIKIVYLDEYNVEKSTVIEKIWMTESEYSSYKFYIRMESGKECVVYSLSDLQDFILPTYEDVDIKKIIIYSDGE